MCKFKNSTYGLKQAAKNWYQELSNFLISNEFIRSKNDYCLFTKLSNGDTIHVLTWVDGIIIAGSIDSQINEVKKIFVEETFKVDERGDPKWFLDTRALRSKDEIPLDQEQ